MSSLAHIRNTRPVTADHLWHWTYAYTGVKVARDHVCRAHAPPFAWYHHLWNDRPIQALVLGSRGSGKSFLSSILTHAESRFTANLGTRILGGSRSQSAQIYEGILQAVIDGRGPGGSDADTIEEMLKTEARYKNGSNVSILSASPTSVRGPHIPRLRLDEVDEIAPDLRESAMGMCMEIRRVRPSVVMTSTWHRVGGPMTELVERGREGQFPLWTTCTFDVLEHCPDERSGPHVGGEALYENCPECPIKQWCHRERDLNGDQALAKLANGHYSLDSLIQKIGTVSARTFESDYLCLGPKAAGLWFSRFDQNAAVTEKGEYDPNLPVVLAIDSGVYTGAVAFQVARPDGKVHINVFYEYLAENVSARENALAILNGLGDRKGSKFKIATDPAGGARNPIGPSVIAEYQAAGMGRVEGWPISSVSDSLATVEALLEPAIGPPRLWIHPRCRQLVMSFLQYRRAEKAGQWLDFPLDPQHPWEDLIDALRGGLRSEFPEGLKADPLFKRVHAGRVF